MFARYQNGILKLVTPATLELKQNWIKRCRQQVIALFELMKRYLLTSTAKLERNQAKLSQIKVADMLFMYIEDGHPL